MNEKEQRKQQYIQHVDVALLNALFPDEGTKGKPEAHACSGKACSGCRAITEGLGEGVC